MDLLAALALVLVIEGLALAIFASSIPELMATVQRAGPREIRVMGVILSICGLAGYLWARSG
ncbi:MAG: DUF2065 family protein [Pseudomonadota bacterium]